MCSRSCGSKSCTWNPRRANSRHCAPRWLVRQEIEMARRALALRRALPEDELPVIGEGLARRHGKSPAAIANGHESNGPVGVVVTFACHDPWRHRRCILQSVEAI